MRAELLVCGAPGGTRTPDPRIRSRPDFFAGVSTLAFASGVFALASGFSPVRWRLIAKVIARLRERSQTFPRLSSGTIHDHNRTSTSYNTHHATPTVPSITPPHPANQSPRYPFTDPHPLQSFQVR